jgi:hypothetical protein
MTAGVAEPPEAAVRPRRCGEFLHYVKNPLFMRGRGRPGKRAELTSEIHSGKGEKNRKHTLAKSLYTVYK